MMKKEPVAPFSFSVSNGACDCLALNGFSRDSLGQLTRAMRLRKAPGVSPQSCLNSLAKVARSA